jgi:hypothetical protein
MTKEESWAGEELYARYAGELEDFWDRRNNAPRFQRSDLVFGHPIVVESNDRVLLGAVDFSLPLFSRAPAVSASPFHIQLVAASSARTRNSMSGPPGPPLANLIDAIWFSGDAEWLMIHVGAWGHAYVDLSPAGQRATVVLDEELAQEPALVARAVLNTILLNFCLHRGYALLHASCLLRGDSALLLMAPHNTGKSTTALHLLLEGGFRLLTDSMVHISPVHPFPTLCGFPVNRIKLRRDMAARFPYLQQLSTAEIVRDETKYVVDLRAAVRPSHPADQPSDPVGQRSRGSQSSPDPTWSQLLEDEAVTPATVELCLLDRHDRAESLLRPAKPGAVWEAAMRNSLFFDRPDVWQRNLLQLRPFIEMARAHHLVIGHDPAGIVAAVDRLQGL